MNGKDGIWSNFSYDFPKLGIDSRYKFEISTEDITADLDDFPVSQCEVTPNFLNDLETVLAEHPEYSPESYEYAKLWHRIIRKYAK